MAAPSRVSEATRASRRNTTPRQPGSPHTREGRRRSAGSTSRADVRASHCCGTTWPSGPTALRAMRTYFCLASARREQPAVGRRLQPARVVEELVQCRMHPPTSLMQCRRRRGSSGGAAQDQFADVCDVQLIRSQGCESGVTSVPHKKASAHALECAWRNVHAGNANIANISCDVGSGFAAHTGTGMFFFFFFRAPCGARIKSPQGRCGLFAGCPPANHTAPLGRQMGRWAPAMGSSRSERAGLAIPAEWASDCRIHRDPSTLPKGGGGHWRLCSSGIWGRWHRRSHALSDLSDEGQKPICSSCALFLHALIYRRPKPRGPGAKAQSQGDSLP